MLVKILDIPTSPHNKENSEQPINKWLEEHGVGIKIRHIVTSVYFLFIFYDKEEAGTPPFR